MFFHPFRSPLRYPGGKRKVASYLCHLYESNGLNDGCYAEPYAGGASVGLALLFGEYIGRLYLNDLDPGVYAFWASLLDDTEALCRRINEAALTLPEWHRHRAVLLDPDAGRLEKGYAAFFMNRTNRSGILLGGVMGGQQQQGSTKLDDRFHRADLVRRVQKIARYRDRIQLTNLDAVAFLATVAPELGPRSLIYLDPPYYVKGQGLYGCSYGHREHATVAAAVGRLRTPWVVSYDRAPEIMRLYGRFTPLAFQLAYSAQERYDGGEVMFFSPACAYRPLRRPGSCAPCRTPRRSPPRWWATSIRWYSKGSGEKKAGFEGPKYCRYALKKPFGHIYCIYIRTVGNVAAGNFPRHDCPCLRPARCRAPARGGAVLRSLLPAGVGRGRSPAGRPAGSRAA
jgi:DNA adenine methylase